MCANRASVISVRQFDAYRRTFNLSHSIKSTESCTITGIAGISKAVGVDVIHGSFEKLIVVIDGTDLGLEQNFCNIYSLKNILEIYFDISIQGFHVGL